jgi:NADP oxidoreductase coenzyme F420-dependent
MTLAAEMAAGTEMRIGILGSGLMGSKLGTILARAGHDVAFSYSRSQRKLQRLAGEAGARARAENHTAVVLGHRQSAAGHHDWASNSPCACPLECAITAFALNTMPR